MYSFPFFPHSAVCLLMACLRLTLKWKKYRFSTDFLLVEYMLVSWGLNATQSTFWHVNKRTVHVHLQTLPLSASVRYSASVQCSHTSESSDPGGPWWRDLQGKSLDPKWLLCHSSWKVISCHHTEPKSYPICGLAFVSLASIFLKLKPEYVVSDKLHRHLLLFKLVKFKPLLNLRKI